MKTLLTSICLLLFLSFNLRARHLPGDWKPALHLGSAYNSYNHNAIAAKCVVANTVAVGQAVGDLKYTNQADFEKIARSFSGSLEAKIEVPFVKAGPSITYAQENAATDQRMNWFFEFHATPKSLSLDLDTLKLSEFGQNMLNDQPRLPHICGNEFIYQIDLGAKLIATMSIEFASKDDKKEFEARASLDVDWALKSVKTSGAIKPMQQRMGSRTIIKIEVHQTGGKPENLAGVISQKAVNCTLSNMEACFETFGKVLEYAQGNFRDQLQDENGFNVVRYHTMPYANSVAYKLLPKNGFPILNSLVQEKRDYLQKRYEEESIAYSRGNYILKLNNLDNLITPDQKAKIKEIYTHSSANIRKLTEAMNICLDQPADNCLQQPGELLKYELDYLEIKIAEEIDPHSNLGKLFKAVKDNNTEVTHTILKENDATLITQSDHQGYSPFHRAIEYGHEKMVDLLICKDPFKDKADKSLIHVPCDNHEEYTPLCLAAKGGTHDHLLCINLLCRAGAGVDCQTQLGLTPLQVAVMHGKINTARKLIKSKANKDILDKHDNTLLHLAAKVGDKELIGYLIDELELVVNKENAEGLTPLHKAAEAGNVDAVEILLAKGANPNVQDNQGQTAVYWAANNEAVLEKLNSYKPNDRALLEHTSWIWGVSFSPDGYILASGSADKTIKLWDANTGELINTLQGDRNYVYSVSFSPDGSILASGNSDKAIILWNPRTGTLIRTLEGFSGWVWGVSFSPDGNTLASGSADKTIKLWNPNTGALIGTLDGHTDSINSVCFSPDGKMLASGGRDKTIKLWDTKTGNLIRTLEGNKGWVHSVCFSCDGKTLASGNKTIQLWNTDTGTLIGTLEGHTNEVYSVSFSFDGKTLASGSKDYTIKLWNTNTRTLIRTLTGHNDIVNSVSFSPDGRTLASGGRDKTIKLWNVATE
jgi:ankyrin repeat protein